MCLEVDLEISETVRKQLAENGGWCRAYKSLAIRPTDRELTSGQQRQWIWRPGWHEAEGELPEVIEHGTLVGGGGFHVLLAAAVGHIGTEFRALERDFVGAGHFDRASGAVHAVFRRLYLPEETYLAYFERRRLVPPAAHAPDGHRRLRRPEWNALESWVTSRVESGVTHRALVDMTPRRAAGSEPTDPVVWYRPAGSTPERPRQGGPRRGRALRSVAVESIVSTWPGEPPEAA